MEISKNIIIGGIVLFLFSCIERQVPYLVYDNNVLFELSTGDVVRDVDMWEGVGGDTLFLVNESEGLSSYEVLKSNNGYIDSLKLLHSQTFLTDTTEVKKVELLKNSRMWVALEDFKYTYIGKIDEFTPDFVGQEAKIDCDTYQSKSTIISDNAANLELLTMFRHLNSQEEVDTLSRRTTIVNKIKFDQLALLESGAYYEDCSDTLFFRSNDSIYFHNGELHSHPDSTKRLNYKLSDIYYNNSVLALANPDTNKYSLEIYNYFNHNLNPQFLGVVDLPEKPVTVRFDFLYGNEYFIGLNYRAGCYIALLDGSGNEVSNLRIAEGFSVFDIQLTEELLILSCGAEGVLVYRRDGLLNFSPIAMIGSSYAYSSLVYGENQDQIIVGTKKGLEIYKIER